ncbi:MAG: hypothetical protein HLUCCA11_20220 [Phormidesmis priestleyi Ana]|uniref:Uncharacterized protein n=1 Tax=Phormidesmis priestleyi Ana TaxID=1666911 RepID=A0A0P8BGQ2_9CYAN|nr:MAG: hypothetical protein HLUCCA11_20220 [Phormidesmis priestleyi Ana]
MFSSVHFSPSLYRGDRLKALLVERLMIVHTEQYEGFIQGVSLDLSARQGVVKEV